MGFAAMYHSAVTPEHPSEYTIPGKYLLASINRMVSCRVSTIANSQSETDTHRPPRERERAS